MGDKRRPLRIMIVDRDRASLRALGSLLEEVGHLVELASDWIAAGELARARCIGLVIADVPRGQRAADAARRVSAEPSLRDVPIILLLDDAQGAGERRAFPAAVVEMMAKPIDVPRMLASIEKYAGRSAADAVVASAGR